jgi:hypothetical protein
MPNIDIDCTKIAKRGITTLAELEAEAEKHGDKAYIGDILQRIADLKAIIKKLENIVYGKWSKGVDIQFQYNREIQRLITDMKGEET